MKKVNQILLLLVLFSCSEDQNQVLQIEPDISVVISNITPGSICSLEGIKISYGLDSDLNGWLEEDEIFSSQIICNSPIEKIRAVDFWHSLQTSSVSGVLGFNSNSPNSNDFNLSKFDSPDSVALCAFLETSSSDAMGFIEVYNVTDDQVIASSRIGTSSTTEVFVATTSNFINDLPDQDFDLGIRLRSENENVEVKLNAALLLLFEE